MWATRHGKALVIVDGPMYPARDDSDYWSWTAEKRQARKEWESILRAQRPQQGEADQGQRGGYQAAIRPDHRW